jgi:proteasome assembly chaperone (PAC2) family protein
MWLDFDKRKVPALRNPALVVAVSTSMPQYREMYSHARELGGYMLRNLKFDRVATIRSSAFPPEVIVKDGGVAGLPECRIDLSRDGRDLLLLTGDTSPSDWQYEFAEAVLDYAQELRVKEVYSVGTRWAENPLPPEADPQPTGFATDKAGVAKLKRSGVRVLADEPAPFFASMIVGMAAERGMRGYKLSVDHGEPAPHPKSVSRLLGVLSEMAGFKVRLEAAKPERVEHPPPRQPSETSIYR